MHCAWQMYWHGNDAVSDLMANRRIECKYTFIFSTESSSWWIEENILGCSKIPCQIKGVPVIENSLTLYTKTASDAKWLLNECCYSAKRKKRKKGDPFTFNVPYAWDYPIIKTNENPVYVEEVNGVDKHTQKWDIIRSTNRNSSIFPFNWWWVGQITTPPIIGFTRLFFSIPTPAIKRCVLMIHNRWFSCCEVVSFWVFSEDYVISTLKISFLSGERISFDFHADVLI